MNAAVLQARHLNHEIINRADQIVTHLTAFATRSPFVSQNGEKRGPGAETRSPQHAVAASEMLLGFAGQQMSFLEGDVKQAGCVVSCVPEQCSEGRGAGSLRAQQAGTWQEPTWEACNEGGGRQDGTAQPTLGCSAGEYARITVKAYFLAITRT